VVRLVGIEHVRAHRGLQVLRRRIHVRAAALDLQQGGVREQFAGLGVAGDHPRLEAGEQRDPLHRAAGRQLGEGGMPGGSGGLGEGRRRGPGGH
jgi:hypothetical protein